MIMKILLCILFQCRLFAGVLYLIRFLHRKDATALGTWTNEIKMSCPHFLQNPKEVSNANVFHESCLAASALPYSLS